MARLKTATTHIDPRPFKEMPLSEHGVDRIKQVEEHRKEGRVRRTARVNLAESPLSWLYARGHISDRQYRAGEALRDDYERASLSPRITMRYDPMPLQKGRRGPAEHLEAGEAQIAAKKRFDDAMNELGGGLKDISWRVICAGEAMTAAEKGLGWPARSAKLVLTLALDRLAGFYRIPGR